MGERYGAALVTPRMMPEENVCEDDLPNGIEAATEYLEGHRGNQ
jgi:hypothetical protein